MAAKIKKISINAWDEVVRDTYQPETVIDWHGNDLHIKRTLGLAETLAFVELCVDACFENGNNEYTPEKLAFAIKISIISMYTNISLPESLEKQYDLIYRSDIIPTVMSYIDREQFDEINTAIDAKVKYRANTNVESFNQNIRELADSLEGMEQRFSEILSDVSGDDMKALIGAVSDGVDEEKLVQAYMAQKGMS